MRALILGCGMQGRAALRDLVAAPAVEHVTCADLDRARAEAEISQLGKSKATATALDVTDTDALATLLADGYDVVIDTLPRRLLRTVTTAAIAAGVHMVNTNYDREIQDLAEPAAEAGVAILAEMGLDPGIDLVMAAEAVRRFDTVTHLLSYGGGIPTRGADDNPLRYRISWTWEGVLDSYARPARLVRDGAPISVPAEHLFDDEWMHWIEVAPFGSLEAVPNGDAAEYAERFGIAATAVAVGRYSVRWPGHAELWRRLVAMGLLEEEPVPGLGDVSPRDFMVSHFTPRLQYGPEQRDAVVLRVEARGSGGPSPSQVLQLVDERDLDTGLFAMSRTVGFTASIGAQMIADGTIPDRGLLSPIHHVPWEPFVAALAARGIVITEAAGP